MLKVNTARALVVFLATCSSVLTQVNFGTVSGRVTDAQGRPLRDAHIELRSTETSALREASSNDAGLFQAANLAPGDYTVEVEATGFSRLNRTIRLEVGQAMRLDLELAVGQKHEFVEVTGGAELLKTSDAEHW